MIKTFAMSADVDETKDTIIEKELKWGKYFRFNKTQEVCFERAMKRLMKRRHQKRMKKESKKRHLVCVCPQDEVRTKMKRANESTYSPRYSQLAVPKKRRVFFNWVDYQGVLAPERILFLQDLIERKEGITPTDARNYFSRLDEKRKKRIKRLQEKKLKADIIPKPQLKMVCKIADSFVDDILNYYIKCPLGSPNLKSKLISESLLKRMKKIEPMRKRSHKSPFVTGIRDILEQLAIWLDKNVNFSHMFAYPKYMPPKLHVQYPQYIPADVELMLDDEVLESEKVEEVPLEVEAEVEEEKPEEIEDSVAEEEVVQEPAEQELLVEEQEEEAKPIEEYEEIEKSLELKPTPSDFDELPEELSDIIELEEQKKFELAPYDDIPPEQEAFESEQEEEEEEEEAAPFEIEEVIEELLAGEQPEGISFDIFGLLMDAFMQELDSMEMEEAEVEELEEQEAYEEFPEAVEAEEPVVTEHVPGTVCCICMKTWASWLVEVTQNNNAWCDWIQQTVSQIKRYAAVLKGEVIAADGKPEKVYKEEWMIFKEAIERELTSWEEYNTEVMEYSKSIIKNFEGKDVPVCPLCVKNKMIVNEDTARKVNKQLVDALKTTSIWRHSINEAMMKTGRLSSFSIDLSEYAEQKPGTSKQPVIFETVTVLEEQTRPARGTVSEESIYVLEEM